MKKILHTLFFFCGLISLTMAQTTFTDDFESYNEGDLVASKNNKWTTWSKAPGGSEDAPVSIEFAHSGKKSVKIEATDPTNGGATDLVLPFVTTPSTKGTFEYEMWMYVVGGSSAYFNFQGVNAFNSTTTNWVLDAFFEASGTLRFARSGNIEIANSSYTPDTWFKFSCKIDLTNNVWSLLIDDKEIIKYQNPVNSLYAIDIFPLGTSSIDAPSLFYVDDVKSTFTPANITATDDAAIYLINAKPFSIAGLSTPVNASIRNVGTNPITSFDLTWSNGTLSETQSFSGQNIASLASKSFALSKPYIFPSGKGKLSVKVSNVNNNKDINPINDQFEIGMRGYIPAPGKQVVVEEGTGTWCQWCPRGAVYMDSMARTYPDHFIGIAVHNKNQGIDPMVVSEYDDAISAIIPGYPRIIVQRKLPSIDPLAIEIPSLEELESAPVGQLRSSAKFDAVTRKLDICIASEFNQNLGAGYVLNCVLTEDGVKGKSSRYNQSNAYANNANGVMGGFEKLANPVPASKMTYNHVARAILGGFEGSAGSLPDIISKGDKYTYQYEYTIPDTFNIDNMNIIAMLIGPDGSIENASELHFNNATGTKFCTAVSNKEVLANNTSVVISPNPVSKDSRVEFTLSQANEVSLRVMDIYGKQFSNQNFGELNNKQSIQLPLKGLTAGIYIAELKIGEATYSSKFVIQ